MRRLQALIRNRRIWALPYKIAPIWHCTFLGVALKRSDFKMSTREEHVAEERMRGLELNVGVLAAQSSINAAPHGKHEVSGNRLESRCATERGLYSKVWLV